MKRQSKIVTLTDDRGDYVREIFDCEDPKRIIIGVHGRGVQRWDGEEFYYQVAKHFQDSVVALVDQNQFDEEGNAELNPFPVLVRRVQEMLHAAAEKYPDTPIWIMAHSMGCAVTSSLETDDVTGILFVAPAAGGSQIDKLVERYGADVVHGKTIQSRSSNTTKTFSKEFVDSIANMVWKDAYQNLLDKFETVHAFESGDDEIISESDRSELRDLPFTSYEVIEGAKHSLSGQHSEELFRRIDKIFST